MAEGIIGAELEAQQIEALEDPALQDMIRLRDGIILGVAGAERLETMNSSFESDQVNDPY